MLREPKCTTPSGVKKLSAGLLTEAWASNAHVTQHHHQQQQGSLNLNGEETSPEQMIEIE